MNAIGITAWRSPRSISFFSRSRITTPLPPSGRTIGGPDERPRAGGAASAHAGRLHPELVFRVPGTRRTHGVSLVFCPAAGGLAAHSASACRRPGSLVLGAPDAGSVWTGLGHRDRPETADPMAGGAAGG